MNTSKTYGYYIATQRAKRKKEFCCLQVIGIILATMALTILVTFFALKSWFFPAPFKPVTLSSSEQTKLEEKISVFEGFSPSGKEKSQNVAAMPTTPSPQLKTEGLQPETYSETDASREINFSERELNGLLANNTDLADKVAIDLADNLISAKMLIPVDPDFPIFGGKTLRVRAGLELAYVDKKPIVKVKGISFMGVPMPNAWMGGIKNVDLVREFGQDKGFWQTFSEGVASIQVQEGQLSIVLKE